MAKVRDTDEIQLGAAALSRCAERIGTPRYERSEIRTGIVHLGVGGFHRSHQAAYLDQLLNHGAARDWAIVGIGVLDSDDPIHRDLAAQACLYTLIERQNEDYRAQVIGSLVAHLHAPADPDAVVDRLADPTTRIVSLTITEGGYAVDPTTGQFEAGAPGIVEDLSRDATPRTAFGLVTAALARRRAGGRTPFTIVSCDNLQGNGRVAKEAFTAFAGLKDSALGSWIEREVSFPNSMVDRITPATSRADRDELRHRYGIVDRRPVVCEPFAQWVLEDRFTDGRPPLEEVGVQIVDDVEPYELMKLRLLNGAHQALAYFAALLGFQNVDEAIRDPLLERFVRAYMDTEATPTLKAPPEVNLENYKRTIIARFSNRAIGDTVARLCAYASDRIPKFVLPVTHAQLRNGGPIELGAAIVASWARYARGIDERGARIEIVDNRREAIRARAARWPDRALAFLEDRELFGDLAKQEKFTAAYQRVLRALHEQGVSATLWQLGESGP
jgi:mannitol 2-dehydrogenase